MRAILAAIVATVLLALVPPTAHAQKTLRVTLQLPLTHHLGQNLLEFKSEVERETKGEIKIEIYPSAQLYKDSEVPKAVASGAIDMGVASLARFAGTIPAVDIFYVPFMFPNSDLVAKATAPGSPIRGPLDEAILKTGARPLWWQAFGGAIILSKRTPIRVPADIKGKKVRVFGKTLGEFVKVLGGAPVLLSGSEQFLAYQRGTVDAGMTGLTTIPSRKLYEVMEYVTVTNHADVEFLVLINEKVWQGLSDSQRQIMTKAGRRVEQELRTKISALEADALKFAREKMKVIELTPAEHERWRKSAAPVVDTYIKNAGPLGAQLVEAARKL
jgi:C4-dicarboxylate-binding protein DctP